MWEAGGGGSADLNIYFPLRGSRAGSWWWKWGDPKAWLVVCDAHRPACLGGKRGARHAEVTGEDPWAKSSLLICFVWLTQYFGKKKKSPVSCPHLKLGRVPLKKIRISIF